jgi:Uncharacterized conserved protein
LKRKKGEQRAEYGEMLMKKLAIELTSRFGKGFSLSNIKQRNKFHLIYSLDKSEVKISNLQKGQTVSGFFEQGLLDPISQMISGLSTDIETLKGIRSRFKLSWSHYVTLLGVRNDLARKFYETEAMPGGWSIRQLNRQINSQFYERTALSRNKAAMLTKGSKPFPNDVVTPEEIKSPFMLEFLGLKDEYSETQLEEALINHLGAFLLELGSDFAFIARQKQLRIDDTWYRVDLVFFHRRLKALFLIDLKLGTFTHADAGQMHLYLNYDRKTGQIPERIHLWDLFFAQRSRKML